MPEMTALTPSGVTGQAQSEAAPLSGYSHSGSRSSRAQAWIKLL